MSTVPSASVGDGDHREHPALAGVARVAHELGDAELVDDVAVRVEVDTLAGTLLGGLRPLPLSGHVGAESIEIHRDVTLAGDLLGQLEREPVGVVEQERGRPRQLARAGLQLAVEDAEAVS